MKPLTTSFLVSALSLFLSLPALAHNDLDYVSLSFENDVLFQEDGGYTNGVAVSWGYDQVSRNAEQELPAWLYWGVSQTYFDNLKAGRQHDLGYSVGQLMQTAVDISQTALVEADAPYAGFLLVHETPTRFLIDCPTP